MTSAAATPVPASDAALPGLSAGHVGLTVTDVVRSRDFYAGVLGLDVLGTSAQAGREHAFLGTGGTLVLTLWQQSDGRFAPDRPGLHHLSFQVADAPAVEAALERLRDLGAELVHDGPVPHQEGSASGGVFFLDPDGTRLEVFAATGAAGPAPTPDAPTCGFF